jgi:hypothetical protein
VKPSASTGVPVPQKSDHEAPGDGTRGIPTAGHPIEEALASLERGLRRFDARRTSLLVLAVAMALSVVALLYFGRGQSFTSDEWLYLTDWPGWSLGSLFHPDNGHLFFTANVVLNASVSIFGTSYEPLRIVTVVLVQVNGGLFYVLARRRVGPVLALLPTILLLFLGSSFGIVLMAFSINSLLSVGFGLCALLALDREDFRGDVTAAAMLALSVLSFEWGLFFAVGMAIEMWVRRNRPPLSRFLLPAIPLVIWGVWKLWAPAEPGDDISVANIGSLFTSAATVAATLLASITGLFRTPGSYSSTINAEWGVPLVVVGVIALGARLRLRGWPSARFFFLAATLILLWLAVGLTINAYRGPTTDRYVYGGAIILFLLLAELLRGVRVPIGAYAGIVIVLAFSLIANVVQLKEAGAEVRGYSEGFALIPPRSATAWRATRRRADVHRGQLLRRRRRARQLRDERSGAAPEQRRRLPGRSGDRERLGGDGRAGEDAAGPRLGADRSARGSGWEHRCRRTPAAPIPSPSVCRRGGSRCEPRRMPKPRSDWAASRPNTRSSSKRSAAPGWSR